MTIFCIWQPDFLSVFVGFEQGNSRRLVGLYALCSTSSGNLIIIHLNFKCFTILSCQSRILSWRKSYDLLYYRLQILNFMVPRNNFFCCTLSSFLRMWLLMGHWTGRSVLQGALQKIFLLTCLAGVYSLTHLHILMAGLQESFHQLWPFIKYQMICLLQGFGCIFPAICICSSFLKLKCLHKCHSWRTKRMKT